MGRKSAIEESDRTMINRYKESKMVIKLPSRKEKPENAKSETERVKSGKETETASVDFTEKYRCLETKARIAINERKIFMIIGGYDVVRNCLLDRGWIEKFPESMIAKCSSDRLLKEANDGNLSEKLLLSQMIRNSPSYFIWQPKHYDGLTYNIYYPFKNRVNRLRTSDFTLKDGLQNCVDAVHWHIIENFTEINYQRSYLLNDRGAREAFLEDFKLTCSTNFINFLHTAKNFSDFFSEDGIVTTECINFAIQRVDFAIKVKEHFFIDSHKSFNFFREEEMINQFDLIMNFAYKFKLESNTSIEKLKKVLTMSVSNILANWPDRIYDGLHNIWILKPTNKCRGNGILLMDNDQRILEYVHRHNENKYLVQKYVERPLLIYNTKFDIRQYFLTFISNGSIFVWMYKDCYIKFSSQEFNLKNYHESIHLTNHSIQQYYKNGSRDSRLPEHNMWSLEEFLVYLKTIGKRHYWEDHIYPSMKKNVLAIVMTSLEETDLEQNTFELNGADFLISFDFDVLLIEINATPDLSFTTPTTKDICTRVMEDVIKVVVDHSADKSAETGSFELIYEHQISKFPMYSNRLQLNIEGKRLSLFNKPFKLFKIQNFSDLIVKGSKLDKYHFNKPPKSANLERVSSKYRIRLKKKLNIEKRNMIKKEKPQRKMLESILIQPNSDEVSDYVQSLSNFLRSNSQSFINLNDLKKCLKLSENGSTDDDSKSFLQVCNDMSNLKLQRSSSFVSF